MNKLTIAFISVDNKHPTTINFNLFGNQYWSDSDKNESRPGDYFIFYVQKKYVYVHKIIRVISYEHRPEIMKNWDGNMNQIVCLGDRLREYTWDEWNTTIGKGAPFSTKPGTNGYGATHTTTWTFQELKDRFPTFNFEGILCDAASSPVNGMSSALSPVNFSISALSSVNFPVTDPSPTTPNVYVLKEGEIFQKLKEEELIRKIEEGERAKEELNILRDKKRADLKRKHEQEVTDLKRKQEQELAELN
jgi:hypothetical protein